MSSTQQTTPVSSKVMAWQQAKQAVQSNTKYIAFGFLVLFALVVGGVLLWIFVFKKKDEEGAQPQQEEEQQPRPKMDVEYFAKNDTGTTSATARSVAHTGTSTGAVGLTLSKVNTVDSRWKLTSGGSLQLAETFDPGAQFTLLVWVKPEGSAGLKVLVSNSPGGWAADGFRLFWNTFTADETGNDRALNVEVGDGTAGSVLKSANNVMVANQWRMVGVTFDRTNSKAVLYIDGVQVGESTDMRFSAKTAGPWVFGALRSDGDWARAVDSLFGWMGISRSIMTPAQVKQQFDMTKSEFTN